MGYFGSFFDGSTRMNAAIAINDPFLPDGNSLVNDGLPTIRLPIMEI
jgi:hypothetical protein